MRDLLYLGSSPAEEDCAQVGDENYTVEAKRECKKYIELIRSELGDEPEGARLAIKANMHDFGTYYEVVCYFDDSNEAATEYAYKCDSDAPTEWPKDPDTFRPKLHSTYQPNLYYVDYSELPEEVKKRFDNQDNLDIDRCYVTGDEMAKIKLGDVEIGNHTYDIYCELGQVNFEDDEENIDEDVYWDRASEMFSCFDWRLNNVYLREV